VTNFLANLDRLIDRFDRPLAAGEAPLRASLLRQVLIGAALACGAYAMSGAFFHGGSRFFPWDLIEVCVAVVVCALLWARQRIHLAALLLLVEFTHPISFLIATLGIRSPYPALLALTCFVAGATVGKRLLPLWTGICIVLLIWTANGHGDLGAASVGTLAGWIFLYGASGIVAYGLSAHLEQLLAANVLAEESTRNAVLEERTRIARDLHDSLAQGFTGILVQLNASEAASAHGHSPAEHIQKAKALAASSIEDARLTVSALKTFEAGDYAFWLRNFLSERLNDTGIALRCELTPELTAAAPALRSAISGIANEAITNVIRHSRGKSCSVKITRNSDTWSLVVVDDGVGFDPASAFGNGLAGLQERATSAGGRLCVQSTIGQGTTVTFEAAQP
jgi:signal transduction histidine kinase